MNENENEMKNRILDQVLESVRERRIARKRRRKAMASGSVLALAVLAGIGLGMVADLDGPQLAEATPLVLPYRMAAERVAPVVDEEVAAAWDSPSALVLVVNENGMEMRALNDSQMTALARKPGCEFGLTADSVMWVSEVELSPRFFDAGPEF